MATAIEVEGRGAAQEDAGAQLRELFDVHGGPVYGLCAVLLGDRTEAEDATQQAFLSAYESLLRGAVPWSPAAWLAAIARNECRDRLRAQARRTFVPATEQEPTGAAVEEIATLNAEFLALRQALGELPERQREAILLYELCGLSYGEIAGILNMSHAAVETLLFRTRKKLRKRVGVLTLVPGVLVAPLAVGEGLAHAVPGFGTAGQASAAAASAVAGGAAGGTAGGGSFAGVAFVKLAALPLVGKVAAVAVTAGVTATMIVGVPGGGPSASDTTTSGGPALTASGLAEGLTRPLLSGDPSPEAGDLPASAGFDLPLSSSGGEAPQDASLGTPSSAGGEPAGTVGDGRSEGPPASPRVDPADSPSPEEPPAAAAGDPPVPAEEPSDPTAADPPASGPDPGPGEGEPGDGGGGGSSGGGGGGGNEPDPPAGGGGDGDPPGDGGGDPPPDDGDGDPPGDGGGDPPPDDGGDDPPPGDGGGDPPGDGDGDPPPDDGDEDPPGDGDDEPGEDDEPDDDDDDDDGDDDDHDDDDGDGKGHGRD